jgi:hypothetical protein
MLATGTAPTLDSPRPAPAFELRETHADRACAELQLRQRLAEFRAAAALRSRITAPR